MSEVSAVSLVELSGSAEWQRLEPYTKRILGEALETRNLLAAISKHTRSTEPVVKRVAFDLLKDPTIFSIVLKYALGISTEAPQDEAAA